jgi:hypothetical protein
MTPVHSTASKVNRRRADGSLSKCFPVGRNVVAIATPDHSIDFVHGGMTAGTPIEPNVAPEFSLVRTRADASRVKSNRRWSQICVKTFRGSESSTPTSRE